MKVSEAIGYLKTLAPDDDIVIAWWEGDMFDVPKEDWPEACDHMESKMDWSNAHNELEFHAGERQ